jgi:hypothetical protein
VRYVENITGGIGELDFFDNNGFVQVLETKNITEEIGILDFFDNIEFVRLLDVDHITGIGAVD